MKDDFTVYPHLPEYQESADRQIIEELNKKGFKFHSGSWGGGPGEVKEIIVSWIAMHPFWSALFLNVLANRIDSILMFFFKWHKRNKKDEKEFIPLIKVTIHKDFRKKSYFQIMFRIDREYSKEEILKLLIKAKKTKQSSNKF